MNAILVETRTIQSELNPISPAVAWGGGILRNYRQNTITFEKDGRVKAIYNQVIRTKHFIRILF